MILGSCVYLSIISHWFYYFKFYKFYFTQNFIQITFIFIRITMNSYNFLAKFINHFK